MQFLLDWGIELVVFGTDCNVVNLLDAPKNSFIDGGIICKHIYGESVLPNPCLYLILLKSSSIQVYSGGIE